MDHYQRKYTDLSIMSRDGKKVYFPIVFIKGMVKFLINSNSKIKKKLNVLL